MKRLTDSPKRRQVLLVAIVTLGVLIGLWFGLISPLMISQKAVAQKILLAQGNIDTVRKALQTHEKLEADLANALDKLGEIEETMVSGDRYSWVVNTLKRLMASYKVEIPNFGQPVEKEMTMLPRFPYKQVTMNIAGAAFYHDLGEFVAGLENQLPYCRIENLEVEPAHAAGEREREKLTFRMDVVTLVRPGS
jgi:hypothetical protein